MENCHAWNPRSITRWITEGCPCWRLYEGSWGWVCSEASEKTIELALGWISLNSSCLFADFVQRSSIYFEAREVIARPSMTHCRSDILEYNNFSWTDAGKYSLWVRSSWFMWRLGDRRDCYTILYALAAKEDEFYVDATTSKASESLLKGWKSRIHAEGFVELDGLTMIVVSPLAPRF